MRRTPPVVVQLAPPAAPTAAAPQRSRAAPGRVRLLRREGVAGSLAQLPGDDLTAVPMSALIDANTRKGRLTPRLTPLWAASQVLR